MIAIFAALMVAQIENLQAAEFKTSNGAIIKVVTRPGERQEVSVTPPNKIVSYRLLMSQDLAEWSDAVDSKSIASTQHNQATNTTLFVMKFGITGCFFDVVPDTLNGDRIRTSYYKIGNSFISGGNYDLQTLYYAEGLLYFSIYTRRGYSGNYLENVTGQLMVENNIPYVPTLFGARKATNTFFADLADQVGADIAVQLTALAQNQGGTNDE